jgi:hypothetical protein
LTAGYEGLAEVLLEPDREEVERGRKIYQRRVEGTGGSRSEAG